MMLLSLAIGTAAASPLLPFGSALLAAPPGRAAAPPSADAGPVFFSPTSIWNAPVPAKAPLDSNSSAIVRSLEGQVAAGPVGLGSGSPIYVVGPHQRTVRVAFGRHGASSPLQRAWNAVPIPPGAQPSPSSDGYMVVYQPSSQTMWEFFKAARTGNGWIAAFGGRMLNVSTDPGYYRNVVGRRGHTIERADWGATASSLPVVAGMMTIKELEAGSVNHALALLVHNTCAKQWAFPAQRSDGTVTGDPTCVPDGAHFRLDPNLNLAALHLPHFVYMVAVAAQRYGIVVDDRTAGVGFRVETPTSYERTHGYDPYLGPENQAGTPGALWQAPPITMMRAFPWSHLQLLKMSLRTKTP